MKLETMSAGEKVELIYDYVDNRPDLDFDTTFVNNMSERIESSMGLTDNQEAALDNIINRFNMLEDY